MEFDKSKVYTVLNADESLIGAKGYFNESVSALRKDVERDRPLNNLLKIDGEQGFRLGLDNYSFFYLVEPAPEKWYVTFTSDKKHFSTKQIKALLYKNDEILFKGTEKECNQWVKEHSNQKLKYRSFRNCNELIETYIKLLNSYLAKGPNIPRIYSKNLELPTIWLVNKEFKNRTLITEFYTDNVTLSCDGIATLNALYEQYTFLDGSPCGVKEE